MTLFHKFNHPAYSFVRLLVCGIYGIFLLSFLLSFMGCSGTPITHETKTTTVNPITTVASQIATVKNMHTLNGNPVSYLVVTLIPSSSAISDKIYAVDLYEKGNYRDTTTISWNQPEINVNKEKEVRFTISQTESKAYFGEDMSDIFSVEVHESTFTTSETPAVTVTPTTNSTTATTGYKRIMITSPKSGDIWHVGDMVTITWTTVNISPDTEMWFVLREKSTGKGYAIGNHTTNTGSFQWTVADISLDTQLQLELNIMDAHSLNNVFITILAK